MSKNTLVKYPATAKQEGFINKLLGEIASFDGLGVADKATLDKMLAAEVIEKQDASYLITALIRLPKKQRAQAKPGYYVHQDGTYLVVVENRQKTSTYAKRLEVNGNKARWVYAPGMGADVAHLTPLTLEVAAQWGHAHGICLICCRTLTDPESVKRGIGPVCAGRVGGRAAAPKVAKEDAGINVLALERRNRRR